MILVITIILWTACVFQIVLDSIQVDQRCCGTDSYEDWVEVGWTTDHDISAGYTCHFMTYYVLQLTSHVFESLFQANRCCNSLMNGIEIISPLHNNFWNNNNGNTTHKGTILFITSGIPNFDKVPKLWRYENNTTSLELKIQTELI